MSNLFLTIYESEDDKISINIDIEIKELNKSYNSKILSIEKEIARIEGSFKPYEIDLGLQIDYLKAEYKEKVKALEEKKNSLPHTFTKTNRHINFNAIEYTDLIEENPEYTRVWTYKGIKSYVKTKSLFPLDAIFEDIKE